MLHQLYANKMFKNEKKRVPWWLRRLRNQHFHCCGGSLIPGPGTSTCCGRGQKKKKKKEGKKKRKTEKKRKKTPRGNSDFIIKNTFCLTKHFKEHIQRGNTSGK